MLAIIGVLATLLLTALGSAKRKARQAACTSNLRQIALALGMYLEDEEKRPADLAALARSKYLPAEAVLLCPEDKTGNWGGLVDAAAAPMTLPPTMAIAPGRAAASPNDSVPSVRYSYLNPLRWDQEAWNRLLKAGWQAGMVACQLHGYGKPNLSYPTVRDFEGLTLRALRDGTVVRRQVFWAPTLDRSAPPNAEAGLAFDSAMPVRAPQANYPWELFLDGPAP